MYVEATDGTETTSFYLNSNVISKVAPNSTDSYENFTIDEPVTTVDGKMYIISTGFSTAFNSLISYDSTTNVIKITTLPALVKAYSAAIEDYGYSALSEDFENQKALLYGMIVASKDSTGKYGVISAEDGTEILSPRYNKIEFIESIQEFIITNSSSKVGIAYSTGETKIRVSYDDIDVMDSSLGLYLVKSNNKYGVIDSSENTIIYIEYDQIGVDTSNFTADSITNEYILCGSIIPAKINGVWRLFDTSGNRLTDEEYDEIGSIASQTNRAENNALVIGETKTIVVGKVVNEEEVYGGVDVKGNTLIPIMFEDIYSLTSAGNTTYYLLYEGNEYNAEDYINVMKEMLGYEEEDYGVGLEDEEPEEEEEDDQNDIYNSIDASTLNEVTRNSVSSETTESEETT